MLEGQAPRYVVQTGMYWIGGKKQDKAWPFTDPGGGRPAPPVQRDAGLLKDRCPTWHMATAPAMVSETRANSARCG